LKFAGFYMIPWKKHLFVQKTPKTKFFLKCQILDIYLGADALSDSRETLVSQKRIKNYTEKCKQGFPK
jgi:hypothetical protein